MTERARRTRPYLALFLLWALYFHPLILHPAQTLRAIDLDQLTGPLAEALTRVVPESVAGAALSWVVTLHVLVAGQFAYCYARSRALNEVGSVVAAVGFMLSSKWMTHLLLAGHTVTAGLAWLPLVLLFVERATDRRSMWSTLCATAAFALLALETHPQWTLYAGAFAVAWTFPRERGRIAWWLLCCAGAVGAGVALSTLQLVPTMGAGPWAAQNVDLEASGALNIGLPTALALLGPSVSYSPPYSWELQGVFGVYWLAAAIAAPLVAGKVARGQFGVLCGLVAFALGGAVLVDWLPGFNLFRVPTRMLLIASFPLAFLAGTTTHALTQSAWSLETRSALARGFRRVVIFVGLPAIVGMWFADGHVWWAFVAYWTAAVLALPLFLRVLQNQTVRNRARTGLWIVILLADLITPIAVLPAVKPQAEPPPAPASPAPLNVRP
ncbi:Uncharacterized protein OS=Methanosphaerula palustris (strain ATCC BAA-1556 / DSM 19958 / E1-9c) GN=Mpal_2176 PE=4 SV=1 [Gemmata massiliana]|uniref:Glycosyltransferase RgtA/B/C/D-like domain-containing protein n=1 Tax=Gemmata massiliana TaxID=1210884 RepID=A0A6P2D472_9BACT|nr:hypothetical protein [Gemmata massiliana]VTR95883.1 Uncharacterized protein OS=Methanosphaerula palustris (strain ATCC BAA-1556 / DSM 19958 / E1-9c) GN=Mpal_2176 PE=4 SV=1 [Gemmata massiliana]